MVSKQVPSSTGSSSSTWTAEKLLLCRCVTWPLDHAGRIAIGDHAAAAINWEQVRRLAARHRVSGMVGHSLLTAASSSLPEDMRAWCRSEVERAGLLELAAAAEAQATIARLAAAGISARLLKGPAVSIAAFGRLGLRTNRDIDILVDPDDRELAAAIVERAGWQRVEPEPGLSEASFHDWLRNHKDFVFVRPDGRMLELHWRLFNNAGLLPALERCAAEHMRYGAFDLPTLPPVENLLYLCVHGAEHAWSRLKWLADIAALLRQADTAMVQRLADEARKRGVFPAVAQAMLMAADLLAVPLPPRLERRLRQNLRARLLQYIARQAMFGGGAEELEERPWGSTLKNLGHYAMAAGARFWWEELRYDLMDVSAAHLPEEFRRFGPFARIAGLLSRMRSRRGNSR